MGKTRTALARPNYRDRRQLRAFLARGLVLTRRFGYVAFWTRGAEFGIVGHE
jgi:hypothetical protein